MKKKLLIIMLTLVTCFTTYGMKLGYENWREDAIWSSVTEGEKVLIATTRYDDISELFVAYTMDNVKSIHMRPPHYSQIGGSFNSESAVITIEMNSTDKIDTYIWERFGNENKKDVEDDNGYIKYDELTKTSFTTGLTNYLMIYYQNYDAALKYGWKTIDELRGEYNNLLLERYNSPEYIAAQKVPMSDVYFKEVMVNGVLDHIPAIKANSQHNQDNIGGM